MTETPPGLPPAPPLPPGSPAPPTSPATNRGTRLGLIVGLSAVGVVVLGVGAFFGIRALVGTNAPATVAGPVESATPAAAPLGTTEYARLDGFISEPLSSSRVVLELPAAENGAQSDMKVVQGPDYNTGNMLFLSVACLLPGDTEKMWDTMTTPGNEYSVYVDVLPASAG